MNAHRTDGPRGAVPRRAALLMEAAVALGVLLTAMVFVAQIGGLSVAERGRNAARQQALEEAANALETARACAWDELTPEWAAAQRLSEASGRLPEGKLTVRVEAESDRPRTKRVTAVVSWKRGSQEEKVELVGLFSARTADVGGKP